jgi:hypothetical protein
VPIEDPTYQHSWVEGGAAFNPPTS